MSDAKLKAEALEMRDAVENLIDKSNAVTAAHRQKRNITTESLNALYAAQFDLEMILARPIKAAMLKALEGREDG